MGKSRLLITGGQGQLGRAIADHFSPLWDVRETDRNNCDVRQYDDVKKRITEIQPDIVVHCAAYTDVDGCELNQQRALAVNAAGTENVARACRDCGARMIYFSTDYVFDGEKGTPYVETDTPVPKTVYGASKLEGERRLASALDRYVILRVAWLYGIYGQNFIKTIVDRSLRQLDGRHRGRQIEPISVVVDQIGNPTWTVEVAKQVQVVIENDLTGLFHCSAGSEISRYQLARELFELLGLDVELRSCLSVEYSGSTPRPRYSSLENKRLHDLELNVMRPYKEALCDFVQTCREELLNAV